MEMRCDLNFVRVYRALTIFFVWAQRIDKHGIWMSFDQKHNNMCPGINSDSLIIGFDVVLQVATTRELRGEIGRFI